MSNKYLEKIAGNPGKILSRITAGKFGKNSKVFKKEFDIGMVKVPRKHSANTGNREHALKFNEFAKADRDSSNVSRLRDAISKKEDMFMNEASKLRTNKYSEAISNKQDALWNKANKMLNNDIKLQGIDRTAGRRAGKKWDEVDASILKFYNRGKTPPNLQKLKK